MSYLTELGNNRNHCSQLRVWLLFITSKQLWMEIKGCDKPLLIFLWTLGAKSISRHHTWKVYVIMEKLVRKSSCTKTMFSRHFFWSTRGAHYTPKTRFFWHFSIQRRLWKLNGIFLNCLRKITVICMNRLPHFFAF